MRPEREILMMTSEVGGWFSGEDLPEKVTMEDINKFFQDVITEFDSGYKLKYSSWDKMKSDISDYFDKIETKKWELFAAQESEAIAETVNGAAGVCSAFLDAVPGVNLLCLGTILATAALEVGLELEVKHLEKTIIEDLVGCQANLSSYDSFNYCQVYTNAVHKNTTFFARMGLAASNKKIRAMFLGAVFCVKKQNKGKCDVKLMKKIFIGFFNATKADPQLVDKYEKLLIEIQKIEDPKEIKVKIDSFFSEIGDNIKIASASICNMLIFAIGVKNYRVARNAAIARQRAANLAVGDAMENEIQNLDDNGNAVPAEDDDLVGAAPEGIAQENREVVGRLGATIKGIGILAGVLVISIGVWEGVQGFEVKAKVEDKIKTIRKEIMDYYSKLVEAPVE